jgi:hypothetical protein
LDRALIDAFPQNAATDTPVDWSIGWTEEQTAEIRHRLAAFEEDWDAPGMEIYDSLSRF